MRERGRGVSLFFSLSLSLSKKVVVRSKVRRCIFFFVFVSVPHERKIYQLFWTSSLLKKEGRTKKNKDGDKQDQKGVKKRQRRKNQIEIKSK